MAYDTKCYDIAEAFLSDEPSINTDVNRNALAQEVQTCIEDFISDKLRNSEPRDPPGWEAGFADNH